MATEHARSLVDILDNALQNMAGPAPGPSGPRLVIACSGGPDSTALLHAATVVAGKRNMNATALHIDHRLHPNHERWQRHVMRLCRRLNMPLEIRAVTINRDGHGPEAAARTARYRAFREFLQDDDILLLAHHRDDQAETLLLHLLRGSGIRGLSGMPDQRRLGRGRLLRPWLHCSRQQLRAYCREQELTVIDDSSNRDARFDRNWLRLEILPQLEQRKPGCAANIARSAEMLGQIRALTEHLVYRELDRLLYPDQGLDIDNLLLLPAVLQHEVIRTWIRHLDHRPPARARISELLRQLKEAGRDRHPSLDTPHYRLQGHRRRLHLHPLVEGFPEQRQWRLPEPWRWPGVGILALVPDHGRQDFAAHGVPPQQIPRAVNWPLLDVSPRMRGAAIRLADGKHHRLKQLFQQAGVPPWHRDLQPFVWHRQRLVAVGDRWQHPALQRWLHRHHLRLEWKFDG